MDPITAALDTCRFAEIEAGHAQSSSPWAVHMPGGVWPITLYVFTGAACNLLMTQSGQRNALCDKSVCLILRAREHIVQDSLFTRPNQPVDLRNPANADRFQTIAFGESPDKGITSTFFVGMAPAKSAGTSLFDALPDVLLLNFDELPSWLCRAIEAIRDELTWQRPGFRSVATRQAELIVIDVIRHYIASHTPVLPAWVALPDHSRVATALREFHRDISRPWTLEMLAGAARTSRSRLIAAAQQELGEGIFGYVTRFRMQEASRLLTDTSLSIGRIAWQVGYRSEAAFSVAFRRYSGVQPRQFRDDAALSD
ncbi:TPA: AraC family transcriptional regulator [Burkholderia stabilis]|nr:AraC family transcriptional regulator [Burkholderia stabilis]HDR9649740.1 AraC family transcriptional regulator [Burkholderia stabilis]HDR9655481.1 AraC family transcriptional regulator [Burkholderia stabilis]HDR9679806.1 AraC family transcriptional regulator [Burkholderia stabilis]